MPTPREDKRAGRLLPSPVTPPTEICFTIVIPNAVQYRAALFGVLNLLGVWSAWDHPLDGTIPPECEEAAQLWRDAIAQSYFSEDCEGMNCLALAACLESNTTVRNIIQQMITQQSTPTYIYPPGQPLTEQQVNAPLNPVPVGCDKDVFWAQMQQFVNYFTQAGTDFLEKLIVYMNAVEGAQFIEMAPVLGTIIDEVQLDKALQFFTWVLDTVNELYQGALTDTLKEEIACAYFCAGNADCTITIERIWDVENERLGGILAPSSIDSIEDLINAALTLSSNPGLAVDIWLTMLAGLAKFAGYLGVRGIDETLAIVLRLAENDANNDWEILCTECVEPVEDIVLTKVGYAGQVFGIVPATVNSGEPFDVQSTVGPGHTNDRLFAFIFDSPCELTLNSTDWTFCSYNPTAALWGYCPVGVPDPTNLGYWIFTRESSGATTLNIPNGLECMGIWVESACGANFTANITLVTPITP